VGPEPGEPAAAPSLVATPPPAAAAPARDPLSRYRSLQVISIVLVLGGFGMLLAAAVLRAGRPDDQLTPDLALTLLLVLAGSGLAIIVGLIMNAVRAIVAREALPPSRYRGPAIFVLLALAILFSVIASVAAAGELLSLMEGGPISVPGALLLLTVTQMGLLAAALLFVAVPNALAGVHLLPERGAWRSVAIGIGVAIPAWVGATLLGILLQTILERLGVERQPGIVDNALAQVDPTVLVLAIVLIAPVAEEIFFRGVVVNAWLREYGPRVAIIGSAGLFSVIHTDTSSVNALIGSIANVLPIFGLGLALAAVYLRTGSLLAPIALHAMFNGLSVSLALAQRLMGPNFPV
jgi:hypothetical protein